MNDTKEFIFLVSDNINEIGRVISSSSPYIRESNKYLSIQFKELIKIKSSREDEAYSHPKNYYHQNELLLDQSLQSGKNIIYEITYNNINTILDLCNHNKDGERLTFFSFPGTKSYSQNPKYMYKYKFILLIPIEHTWLFMSMNKELQQNVVHHTYLSFENVDIFNKLSNIYKHLQFIIDQNCIDTLLLYSNDLYLTLIFDTQKNDRNVVNILNSHLGGRPEDSDSINITKGHISDSIYDATNDCYLSLKKIYEDSTLKTFFNLPGTLNNTFSFFNMGISLVGHKDDTDYYLAAVRVIGCPTFDKEYSIEQTNYHYMNWVDKSLDSHTYVDYAGDIFNKWYSPFGYWKNELDITMLLLYKKKGDEMTVIDQSINNKLIDSRIFETYSTDPELMSRGFNNIISIISGNMTNTLPIEFGLDEHDNCTKILPDMEVGSKVGSTRIIIVDNSFIHPISPEPTLIGTCLSKIPKTEKNYAMIYFADYNIHRFNPNKGVLLHFHISRKPEGNIFYFKELDFSEDPNANLSFGWKKIIPPNSDIFMRLINHYGDKTVNKERRNFGEISCTTPLNNITYFPGHTYITGVAHIKINIWIYLEELINQLGAEGPLLQHQLETDKIYRFYKYSILPWVKKYVWNSTENINKYTAILDLSADYWESNPVPVYLTCVRLRQHLLNDGFFRIRIDPNGSQSVQIIRHLHPIMIYFMIIYRLNSNDLSIKDFSNPFIIMNRPESTFLNFPMGLTTNNENIWISYGEGDCKSYIASFTKKKIDQLCKNTNDTSIDNIDFDLYDDL